MTRQWTTRSRAVFAIALTAALGITLLAQREDVTELRDRLRARYDVLALQNGIALVPRQGDGGIRIIEIREGAVAINGEEMTGRELRDRLGQDAELVLRVTYLALADQRQLATTSAAAPPVPSAAPVPPAPAPPPAA